MPPQRQPKLIFYTDAHISAALSTSPSTFGDALVTATPQHHHQLRWIDLDIDEFVHVFQSIRVVAHRLYQGITRVNGASPRIALITTGLVSDGIKLTPLNGTEEQDWSARSAYDDTDKDDKDWKISDLTQPRTTASSLDSKGRHSPRRKDVLSTIQQHILTRHDAQQLQPQTPHAATTPSTYEQLISNPNTTFHGLIPSDSNPALFAKLVQHVDCTPGTNHWRMWESESHVAFLTPFSNRDAFTVVVPRRWLGSDLFGSTGVESRRGKVVDEDAYLGMVKAVYDVARLLDEGVRADDDDDDDGTADGTSIRSVGIMFEGFEIDYAHAKVVPIRMPIDSSPDTIDYVDEYQGFIDNRWGPELDFDACGPKVDAFKMLLKALLDDDQLSSS